MIHNPTIDTLLNHRSIRKFTEENPSEEIIETIVKAGQQAAFAGQLGSLILSRERKKNPFGAPLHFIICVDLHRMEKVMEKRGWKLISSDMSMLLFGIQDASYMAQNIAVAAESLGLGTCYLGFVPFRAENLIKRFSMPKKVFPLVGLAIGFPAEDPPTRPRYPLDFTLFDGKYPDLSEEQINKAMEVMDKGYLEQDYYQDLNAMIKLDSKEETFTTDDYSWTEHISRKWGQWLDDPEEIMQVFRACGFFEDKNK